MGRYNINLVGESHYQPVVAALRPGDPVRLEHEPDNPHDRRAVRAVDRHGRTIGYVARDTFVQRLMIDEGWEMPAQVAWTKGGDGVRESVGVVIEVVTAGDALSPVEALAPPPRAAAAPLYPGQRPPGWEPSTGRRAPSGVGPVVLVVLVVLLGMGWLGGAWQDKGQDAAPAAAGPTVEVTPAGFTGAWRENEMGARQRFSGARLRVSGKVVRVTVNLSDEPVLYLDDGGPLGLAVHFAQPDRAALGALRAGDGVTVICGKGRQVVGVPVLLDCVLAR